MVTDLVSFTVPDAGEQGISQQSRPCIQESPEQLILMMSALCSFQFPKLLIIY